MHCNIQHPQKETRPIVGLFRIFTMIKPPYGKGIDQQLRYSCQITFSRFVAIRFRTFSRSVGSFLPSIWCNVEIFALGLVLNEASNLKLTLHMVTGHPFDVSKSLLGRSDQLGPPLLQPPLVLVLLVEPAQKKCSLRFDQFLIFLVQYSCCFPSPNNTYKTFQSRKVWNKNLERFLPKSSLERHIVDGSGAGTHEGF